MSTRHIATTIQSAQHLFSPESVEQIIREANCQHYADLYGRCVDCGKTWKQREEPRSGNETV